MHGIDFVIPLKKEDLQQIGSPGQYVVEQITSKSELPGKLRDAFVSFSRQGPTFIILHFDVLYSALLKFRDLAPTHQAEAWKIVSQAIQQLNAELDKYLSADEYDKEIQQELVTITKMTVYLLCSFLEALETINLAVPGADGGKTGRKKKRNETDSCCDLEAERNFALVSLDALVQMPIHKLWSPPVVEQDFVNLVSNLCYKVLENPVISHVRMKGTREAVFRVIGALVKRYNHGLSCTLKIIQLLQHFEHAVAACVHGLVTLIEQFNCGGMVVDLVREIGRVDPRDLARDTSSSRNYSSFLSDLAEKVPAAFIPCVSLLSVHLEEESHTMRNSVLSIFAEIVIQELSGEELDDKKRDLRDQLLEPILEHLHDVHSFVRSKCLQLWHKLCSKQAIPLNLQHRVLSLTAGRLVDKTSTVRKNAVQLLTALMQGNPYASRLPLKQLETQLQLEQKKLDDLIQLRDKDKPARPQIDPKHCGPTRMELWNAMEPEVLVAIQEVLEEDLAPDPENELEIHEPRVLELLNAANYKLPARMLILATLADTYAEDDDDEEKEEEKPEAEDILEKLRVIYVGDDEAVQAEEERQRKIRDAVEEDVRSQESDEEAPAEEESKEISQQRIVVLYLKDSQAFASSVHAAIPVVCQLLCSKQTSDILEAIDFFVTAFEFEVLDAMVGVRRMLSLVWSSEQDVKTAVVNAYKRLYMNMENPSKKKAIAVVGNLTALISCSTQGELASLEELVAVSVKSGDLPKLCVQVMWERFSMTLPDTTEEESRSALMLLSMVSSAQVAVVTSNVNVLVQVGLGERGARDFKLAHLTCNVLAKMAPGRGTTAQQNQDAGNAAPMRFPPTHEIFERTVKLLLDGISRVEDTHYCQFAVSAVALIYALAEHPDNIVCDVLKAVCKIAYKSSQDLPGTGENGELEVPSAILTRMFVFAGQVAIRHLVHLDVHVYSELRRRARIREEKLEEASTQRKRNQMVQSASRRRASSARPLQQNTETDTGDDDELVGAVADDDEAEYVRKICETEIVTGNASFLSLMAPLVVAVNSNPAKYPNPALRAAAALCLAEFMLVSQAFCTDNLRLLFTVLEKSPEEVIRSNLVIALGDLNFRFPNQIEPWTPHLYGRLRDTSPMVKRTTLNVLTHLILNDMVKVKGQISDIALCIIDPDPRISGMSRMFFSEFARKGNALYNVMPDIISRLCDPEAKVEEEDFCTILKWIMALIQKEKQSESLVEKIVLRLGASRTERQSRDLIFCLSLLTFNERSLRRLLEHWNCLSDKIHNPAVGDTLNTILAGAKKLAKPEVRALIEEVEAKIQETLEADEDEQQVVRKATQATATAAKGNNSKGRRKRAKAVSSEEEDNEEDEDVEMSEEDGEPNAPQPGKKKATRPGLVHPAHAEKGTPLKPTALLQSEQRKKAQGRRKKVSDAEEEEEEEPNRTPPRSTRSNASTRRRVIEPSSEEEEEEDENFKKPAPRAASKPSEKARQTRSRR